MTKKHSKCLFVVFAIILVVCLVASFVNFTYPFAVNGNYHTYSNFVSNLRLGDDIGDSLKIVYRATLPDGEASTNYSNLRTSTMQTLKSIVQAEGFKDVTLVELGDDCISLNVGNILTKDEENSISNLIGNPKTISFATNSDGTEVFATGKNISNVYATQYAPQGSADVSYIVVVEFKPEFKDMIAEKTSGKTVYIYLGENQFAQLDYSSGSVSDGVIYLQSETFKGLSDATTCANQIKTGMLDLELTQISKDTISPSYGYKAQILLAIVVAIAILGVFVYLILKYKQLGWLSCFAMLFYVVLGLFFIQSIPVAHINLGGLVGVFVALLVAVDSLLVIFEKAKTHYAEDMKLFIAFKLAQKESLFKICMLNALTLIIGFVCVLMPSMVVQSFGWMLLVLSLVSAFISLVLMRLFIKMYVTLNNTKGEKCNFHKGGKNV